MSSDYVQMDTIIVREISMRNKIVMSLWIDNGENCQREPQIWGLQTGSERCTE